MSNLISFMHISLDGFVAGPNGEMNWITLDQEVFDQVGQRVRETDTALYGRVTYQMMEAYWPTAAQKPNPTKHEIEHSAWYAAAHRIVLSTTLPDAGANNTTIIRDQVAEQIISIKQKGDKDILVFGSPSTTHTLIQLGLIDGYWLFVNPIVLGKGIPLFTGTRQETKLQLQTSTRFACGVNELSYLARK